MQEENVERQGISQGLRVLSGQCRAHGDRGFLPFEWKTQVAEQNRIESRKVAAGEDKKDPEGPIGPQKQVIHPFSCFSLLFKKSLFYFLSAKEDKTSNP